MGHKKQLNAKVQRSKRVSTGSFSGNIKTLKHTFPTNKFLESTQPRPQAQNAKNIPSFTHTFHAKIKQGRLQKGGVSTANPKKEHHYGGAVCLV
jgi:hypothetical protein